MKVPISCVLIVVSSALFFFDMADALRPPYMALWDRHLIHVNNFDTAAAIHCPPSLSDRTAKILGDVFFYSTWRLKKRRTYNFVLQRICKTYFFIYPSNWIQTH